MGLTLGLAAGLTWGVADFTARFASRRAGSYRTSFFMQLTGLMALSVYFCTTGGWSQFRIGSAGWQPWAWAIAGGILNAGCSLAFYRSLETGVLAIVAPISSSYPALTLLLSVWSGEKMTALRLAGVFVILAGVIFASTSFQNGAATAGAVPGGHHVHLSRGVGWAIAACLGFGVMFWLLGFHVIPALGGFVSVWVVRGMTFLTLGFAAVPARQSLRLPGASVFWMIAAVGIMDTAAFVFNNLGLTSGDVAVVTVLASLFGAVTVFLAWIFLRERLERNQWLGILLIFLGIVFVSR
ncbi:MAG: EamA family transporter [Candidatus Acidiferrales bacterium]